MPFLAAVAYLCWSNLLNSLALVSRGRRALSLVYFGGGTLGGLLGLYQVRSMAGPQTLGGANSAVWFAALFGCLSLLLALGSVMELVVAGGDRTAGGWRLGSVVFSALTSVLVCWAVADHIVFCAGSRIAVLDPRALEVADMPCEGLAIARLDDGRVVRYRCARSMVWGMFTDTPFIPWPSYSEGTSSQLQAAIARMRERAVKLE